MKKFLSLILLLTAGSFLFAESAVVTYVKGKVEVQKNNQWVPLKAGDQVSKTEIISTGFQSEAKVKLLDSVLYLGPVTRVAVEELTATSSNDKVSVYLKTGTVRSQVNHTENKRVNYQVHTAVAVASARGTDYIVCNDETIVLEGIVAVETYTPPVGQTTSEIAAENEESSDESSEESTEESTVEESKAVLVKANQSVKVVSESDSNGASVSAPVNAVVQNMNAIVSAGATAASKEAVKSATGTTTASPVVQTDTEVVTTGFVDISINIVE